MTDEELIAQWDEQIETARAALEQAFKIADAMADRIDAYAERERIATDARRKSEARAERLEAALREIAADASVTVHTWKNGINFKKMYEGWRKIATDRIDIARAALKGADHD